MRTLSTLFAVAALAGAAALAQAGGASLKVGIANTFFHDMTPGLIQTATEPFADVMRETSGLTGTLSTDDDPFAVANDLGAKKLQLGVFHGFEYAWLLKDHPELKPLTIAVSAGKDLRAFVVVRKDNPAMTFADLKGKPFATPKRSPEHARFFVEALARQAGAATTKDFFGTVALAANIETALDEVVQGKVAATVTDTGGLDFYKDLKPGVAARLRIIAKSEAFPPMVVAYRPGGVSDATLAKVMDGLRSAEKTEKGRDMLRMWKVTSFEPVPKGFEEAMARSLKDFPRPGKN